MMKESDSPMNSKQQTPENDLDKETRDLLKEAFAYFLQAKSNANDSVKRDARALVSVVEEFLSCFVLLGYTFDGSPIKYICAHDQQQFDSLSTLVSKLFDGTCSLQSENDESGDEED